MLGAKGQLKENIAHNPDAGRMSISQIRELTETIKNQDSANISSSSMLNRLDSYLTLPWLKPRDSCELGLLALGR